MFFPHLISVKQQPGFSISEILTINTHSVHEMLKSKLVEIHSNNSILPPKMTEAIFASEIRRFTQNWWSMF